MDDTDDEVILLDDPILDATPFIEEVDVMTDDYDELIILRRPDYLIELGV